MKFTKATPEEVFRSRHMGYIVVSYEKLAVLFGPPNDRIKDGPWQWGDGKIRAEWAFKSEDKKSMIISIYDFKEEIPVDQITFWHVKGKGDIGDIERFLAEHGIDKLHIPRFRDCKTAEQITRMNKKK